MKILDKHIFSRSLDIIAFSSWVPIFIGFALYKQISGIELGPPDWSFMVLGWTLVDGSHVYSTIYVTLMDKEVVKRTKNYLIGVPLLIFAINYSLISAVGDKSLYVYFLAYLAFIHFVRQEYGWMKIASRLDKESPKWLYYIDLFTAYGITLIPIIYSTRASTGEGWYQKGDLFGFPDHIASVIFQFYIPIVVLFIAANAYHFIKVKKFNLSKLFVFLNTFFGWYISKFFFDDPRMSLWVWIFSHGFPYYVIVFKTQRVTDKYSWMNKLGFFKYLLLYLGSMGIFYAYLSNFSAGQLGESFAGISPFTQKLFWALVAVPQMSHFVLDGVIWRKKVGLVENLYKKPEPVAPVT